MSDSKWPRPVNSGADVGNLKNETDELWDLLKKTQSEVNIIENEMNRVETENIHRDWGFKIQHFFEAVIGSRLLLNPLKDQELEELLETSKKDVDFPVSCQEYADNGATQNGSYRVQPNKNISRKYIQLQLVEWYRIQIHFWTPLKYISSFPVDCEFNNGIGWSVFKPSFSQSTSFTATPHTNDGCEEPGCYEDHVTYGSGLASL